MKKIAVCLLFVVFFAASCVMPGRKVVTNAGNLGSGEVMVVGKVVFDPPLVKADQELLAMYSEGWYRNKGWLFTNPEMYSLKKLDNQYFLPLSPLYSDSVSVVYGEVFYSAGPAKPFYILGGCYYSVVKLEGCGYKCTRNYYQTVLTPGNLYVDIKAGDKAVYIGTIKYTRSADSSITKTEILDEYDREMPEFRRLFGTMKLRKAIAYRRTGK